MEIKGSYSYSHKVYDGRFRGHKYVTHNMPVTIINETDKSYKIRFDTAHADGRKAGSEAWVNKDSITKHEPRDMSNVRTPYKD